MIMMIAKFLSDNAFNLLQVHLHINEMVSMRVGIFNVNYFVRHVGL